MTSAGLPALLGLTLLGALASPWLTRALPRSAHLVLALIPAAITVWLLSQVSPAAAGNPAAFSLPWIPGLGLELALRADGLSLLYALLIAGIGTLVVLYAGGYLSGHGGRGRFYLWLFLFMTSMLGVALADNLLLLFLFWELTTLSSFMLIGFERHQAEARDAALQALLVTALGGLAMLAGLLLLGQAAGTFRLSELVTQGGFQDHELYLPVAALVLLGAATKSALFPFHFWLPAAMAAPTPVSAYLHAATMVKAGIYLLLRLNPVLGDTDFWQLAVGSLGAVTMVMAATLAPLQADLKRLLAYATISVLGLLTLMIALGTDEALKAALVFLVAHAFYKGALFFVAGSLDHETGSRDIRELRGLGRAMPLTALGAGLAAVSMAGIPPLLGFVGKEEVLKTALTHSPWLAALVVWTGVCYVLAAGLMAVAPFAGRAATMGFGQHDPPPGMWLAPVLLGMAGLVTGLAPEALARPLLRAAGQAAGQESHFELALWHGVTPTLLLSLASIGAGIGLYAVRSRWLPPLRRLSPPGPAALYRLLLRALLGLARHQTGLLQSGHLPRYMATLMITFVVLVGWGLLHGPDLVWPGVDLTPQPHELGVAVLILACAAAALLLRQRLATIAALGATGYAIALLYMVFGAPDLAMAQFLVESLTAILLVVAFHRLPDLPAPEPRGRRLLHGLIALSAGAVMTGLVWLALVIETGPRISRWFADNSVSEAHSHNVVNAIVVDFRAMDTLGEITVLAVAALGALVLIRERRRRLEGRQHLEGDA